MANIKSAKKRIRVIEAKTQRNRRVKTHIKEALKAFYAAVEAGDQKEARNTLAVAEKRLMQAAAKGVFHKNTASRKVSRITTLFVKTFGNEAILEKAEAPAKKVKEVKPTKAAKPAKKKAAKEETEEVVEEKVAPKKKSTKKESIDEATETAEEVIEEAASAEEVKEVEETEEAAEETAVEESEEKTEA